MTEPSGGVVAWQYRTCFDGEWTEWLPCSQFEFDIVSRGEEMKRPYEVRALIPESDYAALQQQLADVWEKLGQRGLAYEHLQNELTAANSRIAKVEVVAEIMRADQDDGDLDRTWSSAAGFFASQLSAALQEGEA